MNIHLLAREILAKYLEHFMVLKLIEDSASKICSPLRIFSYYLAFFMHEIFEKTFPLMLQLNKCILDNSLLQ